jgi:hypothetical protein
MRVLCACVAFACAAGPRAPAARWVGFSYDAECLNVELHDPPGHAIVSVSLRFLIDGRVIGSYQGMPLPSWRRGAAWRTCINELSLGLVTDDDRVFDPRTHVDTEIVSVTLAPLAGAGSVAPGSEIITNEREGIVESGVWQPTARDIAALEARLAPRLTDAYFRKYEGLAGRKIAVSLECERLEEGSFVHGGGTCFGYTTYDVGSGSLTEVEWNDPR